MAPPIGLTCCVGASRWLMMQKVRGHTLPEGHSAPSACKYTVSGSISHSSSEFFSPFPHGTSSLSVTGEYLGLDDGPPRFPQDFSCPVVLRNVLTALVSFVYGSVTLFAPAFQLCLTTDSSPLYCTPYNPKRASSFGLA